MTALPLRIRLAAWYFAVLALSFLVFGVIAFLVMRHSVLVTVDQGLRNQADGVRDLIRQTWPSGRESLVDELRELEGIRAGRDLLQVSDEGGNWIYRSEATSRYGLAVPKEARIPIVTQELRGRLWRVLTFPVGVPHGTYIVQIAAPLEDFYEALHRFRRMMFLFSPFLLLLASGGGYWLSRRALAPVDQITQEARTITAHNLSCRLAVPRARDELHRLSETLNAMLERLEGAFNRITRFTADASHELRTPVALMRTRAELALRRPRSEDEYREALLQVLKELERTSGLIEQMLLLARADSGAERLQRVRLNLVESVAEACREGRTLAMAKQISFHEQLPAAPVWVEGDAHSLQRLFLILVDNAVKYTPPEGRIDITLATDADCAVVKFRDTGIGIAAEDLPNIFERFYRSDRARSRQSGGTGLGLSIGRWIAEAHDGKIEVRSTPGEGSVFEVRLPVAPEGGTVPNRATGLNDKDVSP
jgi:heavy metal sensor kinase